MLAKLLKYEFKATGRVLLPVYAVLLVLSLLAGDRFDKIPWGSWYGIVQGLIMMLYGCVFGAALVVTVLLLIQRFYKNLLRDEGYLMNTLPVKPWQNVAAKLICATVWSVVGIGAATLSVFLMGMDGMDWWAFFHDCGQIISMLNEEYGANLPIFALEIVLAVLAALAQSIVSVYLALAIGHIANRAKILWSVVAYIGISVVEYLGVMLFSTIEQHTHCLMRFANYLVSLNDPTVLVHAVMGGFTILNVLLGGAMFVLTAYILKHHLNLE